MVNDRLDKQMDTFSTGNHDSEIKDCESTDFISEDEVLIDCHNVFIGHHLYVERNYL